MEISAGFSPAWIRLEGGCLIYSSHESFEKWRAVPVLPRPRGVLETLLRCWRPAHDCPMAAAAGFAPTRTGSEPVMLLLHHAAPVKVRRPKTEGGRRSETCLLSLNWSVRGDLHSRSLGPRPSMLLLHYTRRIPALEGAERRTRTSNLED